MNPRPPQADAGGQVEQQNKEPQNDEVITSIFDPPEADLTFCGSKNGSQDALNLDWFSPEFCLLTSNHWAFALSLGP